MPSPRLARAVTLGVGGLCLIALAAALRFVLPQLGPQDGGGMQDQTWLLSWGVMRFVAAAAVAAGAWLLVLAWNTARPSVDDDAPED